MIFVWLFGMHAGCRKEINLIIYQTDKFVHVGPSPVLKEFFVI